MEQLRAKFLEVYANIPASIRDDIVLLIDGKTYSWNTVYTEVVTDSPLGDKMLQSLKELRIISDE